MSNIKLNVKQQAIVIKHYKGNSVIRSYNFIMKKALSQLQVLQITSFSLFLAILDSCISLPLFPAFIGS